MQGPQPLPDGSLQPLMTRRRNRRKRKGTIFYCFQQTKTLPKHTIEPVISTSEPESTEQQVAISFVVPVMNEEQSIAVLFGKLSAQLDALGQSYEVIFVDDGSTDNTFAELKKIH